jgi:release factor glutamine methyltransferase
VRADLLEGVGEVDAVVSNPPYVEDGADLPPEIARHEPAEALYAGLDGLAVVRRLVAQAGERGAAFLALEVGAGQALAVEELARAAGFDRTERRADLAGIERVVTAWR